MIKLIEERKRLWQEMFDLNEKLKRENRDFTPEEQRQWDRLDSEHDSIDARIKRGEALETIRRDTLVLPDIDTVDSDGRPVNRSQSKRQYIETPDGQKVPIIESHESLRGNVETSQALGSIDQGFDWTRLLVSDLRGDPNFAKEERDYFTRALGGQLDPSGGYMLPDVLSFDFLDEARNASVAIKAGARTIPMTSRRLDILRQESGTDVYSKPENTEIPWSDSAYGLRTMNAFSIMSGTKVSRELLEDSANGSDIISRGLAADCATALDGYAFTGVGGGEPTGLTTDPDVNTQTVSAAITMDHFIAAIGTVADNNGPVEGLSVVFNSDLWQSVEGLKDGDGTYLGNAGGPPSWTNTRKLVTNSIPTVTAATEAYLGDYRQLALGLRMGMTVRATSEGTATGYNQVWVVAITRADWCILRPAWFVTLEDVTV